MLERNLQKKYDFFEFNSELEIPTKNIINEKEVSNLIQSNKLIVEKELIQYYNNLKIEGSTIIIKAQNELHFIFSVDNDLPPNIDKNIYSIHLDTPLLQVMSFMHESKDESILISTGNSIDNIKVFQFHVKKLMHEYSYTLLNYIKNSIKIIPIKDSLALVLHYPTQNFKNGGLKLWKNFNEEIYNFNKVYNFTFNYQYNKVICLDNIEAPFTFSIYSFDESHFNKKNNELLQPEFFISLEEYIKNIQENEIENFLHFESFMNIICFWVKTKKASSGYILGFIFVNFNAKKCYDSAEFIFDSKNKYFFKYNKITNEIYVFNLTEELLHIYGFKKHDFNSGNNLYITKINFTGNIKGVDFTTNNGLVILTEQNNLVCYTKNENIFKNFQKEYKTDDDKAKDEDNDSISNINNNSLIEEDLIHLKNNINILFNNKDLNYNNHNINNKNEDMFFLTKQKSETIPKLNLFKKDLNNNKNKDNYNKIIQTKKIEEKKIANNDKNNIITIKLDSYTQTPKHIKKMNKVDKSCQTDEKKEEDEDDNDNNNISIKEKSIEEDLKQDNKDNDNDNNNENVIDITKKKLERAYNIYIKQKEIKNKFISINNEKIFISKLIKSIQDNITKLENNILKNITQNKLDQLYKEIILINSNLNNNINNNERINNLYSKYKSIDILLIKSKSFILQIRPIIFDIENTQNKIIEIIKTIKNINDMKRHNDSDTNDDYESLELIYNTLKIELKNNNNINKKIEKMLYKCNSIDENLDIISEANSYFINNENKLHYLYYVFAKMI